MRHWLKRKQWQDNQIKSNAKAGMYFMWGFTLLWNVISFPMLFTSASLINSIQDKPETALVLLFPIIGVFLLAISINSLNNWRKFGLTPLVLDPFPGAISGHVGGKVQTHIAYDQNLNFIVTLSCLSSYISGSGKDKSRREKVIWQTEGVCFTESQREGSLISFRFNVPTDLPESDPKNQSSYHLWRVNIRCSLPGTDYDRSFEIPVYKGEWTSSIKSATEDYHKTLDKAQDDVYEVAQITVIPGGLEFYYPPLKRPTGGIMALMFGVIFTTIGIVMWRYPSVPIIFPVTFTPIGLSILFLGIWELGKSLRVRVNRDQLFSRRFFLKYPLTSKSVSARKVSKLAIKESSSVSSGKKTTVYYSLIAHTLDEEKLTVAERLASKPEALLIKENLQQYLPLAIKKDQ